MSEDGSQRRGSKELFWAIPRGTVSFEPAPVIKLKPAEYERRVQGERDDALLAELKAKPLAPCTREEMIERKQK